MSVLLAVAVPAISGLKGSGEFSRGVDQIASVLNQARAHAVAKNTYVWVGFFEESPNGTSGSAAGTGQVVLGIVASVDGTRIYEEDSQPAMLPGSRVKPVGRIQKIPGMHMADVGAPSGSGDSGKLDRRPDSPYAGTDAGSSRIGAENGPTTSYPFQISGYTFSKTIRFSPSGEATINGAAVPKLLGEIGLAPANGGRVSTSPNLAAVQFSGFGGTIRTYRR